jgi:uncharacterized membrane protein
MKKLFLLSITLLFGVSLGFAQSNTRLKSAPTKSTQNFTVSNKSGSTQKVVRGTRPNDPKVAGWDYVDKDGNTWKMLRPTQPGAKETNSTETKVIRGTRPNDPKVAGWDYVDKDGNTWKMLSPTQQGGIKSPIKGKTPVRTAPARGSRNVRR